MEMFEAKVEGKVEEEVEEEVEAKVEELTLRALAREALEDADGERHKALPALVARLKSHKELYSQVVGKLVKRACLDELGSIVRDERGTIWAGGHPGASEASERVAALARSNLLNFVLPSGKRLAHASRAECMQQGEDYLKQGLTMCHLGRWLRLIGQSVPDGEVVHKVLTEDRLNELRAEAEKNGDA